MSSEQESISYEITEVETNPIYLKIYGLIFILLVIFHLVAFIIFIMDPSILMIYLSAFFSLILPTFLSGLWFYNEITAKSDYLKISLTGIDFKSTPVAFHGFFPKKGFIPFKSIKYATLVIISTRLDISEKYENRESFKELLEKPLVLQIVYAEDKKVLIGERFPNKKLIQAILLIETGAGLAQTWKKISEKFPAIKNIITDVTTKLSGWLKRN